MTAVAANKDFSNVSRERLADIANGFRERAMRAEAVTRELRAALEPFAHVIDILKNTQEMDRYVRIGFVPVHADSSGTGALLKTFIQEDFERAHAALNKL